MNNKEQFKITEAHLKLLKHMYVSWDYCEFGAPAIDPKRPYGNSDCISDILDILGLPHDKDNESLNDYARKIHKDMGIVLQIVLVTQSFKCGIYEKQNTYNSLSWKLIN